jgi:hypothetical protein
VTEEERDRLRYLMAEDDKNRVRTPTDGALEDLELFQRCAACELG